jgi:hypothetical protein
VSLLSLPQTSLLTKLRYGSFVFACTHRKSSPALDKKRREGMDCAGVRGEWLQTVLALFIGVQVLRGRRQDFGGLDSNTYPQGRALAKERHAGEMGYLDGGSEILVRALVEKIESGGGRFSQQGRTKKDYRVGSHLLQVYSR